MHCCNKPNCLAPIKEKIKKRPRGKRGAYKNPGIDIPSYLLIPFNFG